MITKKIIKSELQNALKSINSPALDLTINENDKDIIIKDKRTVCIIQAIK